MSDFDDLLKLVMELKRELAEVRHVQANQIKTGTVEEVDGKKGYRLKLGTDTDGKTVLSPWYPHPESGGALKTWIPLRKGEIVHAINPGGDSRQGFLVRGGFSDDNRQPSEKTDENVLTFGPYTFSLKGDALSIKGGPIQFEAGGTTWAFTSAGLVQTGGKIKHDGKNIGSDHRHGGVQAGGSRTDVPDA